MVISPYRKRKGCFSYIKFSLNLLLYYGNNLFFIGIIYYFSTKPSLGFLSDTILCLSGGYFIPKRKSRALSVFLLSYAGLTTVLNFLLILGLSKDDFGTKNIFLGMGLIAISYRSLFATYVYHRLIKS